MHRLLPSMRWALPALFLSQLACSANFAAVDQFSAEQTCPQERLTVKEVDIAKPADILDLRQPPPGVAADPERLALWNQVNQVSLDNYEHLSLVDITGCGVHRTYFCWWESDGHNHSNPQRFPVDLDREDAHFEIYLIKPAARLALLQRLHASDAKPPAR